MAGSTTARPPNLRCLRALSLAFVAGGTLALGGLPDRPAYAQAPTPNWVGVPPRSSTPTASSSLLGRKADPTAQMLVQAGEIHYDNANERVHAVGNVQIHYLGSVLEAQRVTYDQKTKRMFAEGSVRLTEADGKIINAERLDLNEDFRDGFVDSLHVETAEKLRISAPRAERSESRLTVFQSGVYTACEPCVDAPAEAAEVAGQGGPHGARRSREDDLLRGRAYRAIRIPDRIFPIFLDARSDSQKENGNADTVCSVGNEIRARDPDAVLLESRPRLRRHHYPYADHEAGADDARRVAAASSQWLLQHSCGRHLPDRQGCIPGNAGYRDFRGAVDSKGDFRFSEKWFYGWDAAAVTDSAFFPDYKVLRGNATEIVSQAYLFGRGDKSYFDGRLLHFYGLSPLDIQQQLPIVHPLVDYKYVYGAPVFGGELSYNVNLTSLSRQQADFDPVTQAAATTFFADGRPLCDSNDPLAVIQKTRANCLLRGIPGTYTRFSAEANWRRTIIDSYGQMFTPFAFVRADLGAISVNADPGVGSFIGTGESSRARVMPGVGLEYRYPFISAHSWGSQTIEPIAQVILRPDETQIGKFPNEDSQSLLFDDANLFQVSKYSGWDRVEGGGRANVGLQYTAQFNRGGYFNALVGQSYRLFGQNSYAVADMANTGVDSGLETDRSDYVARTIFQPNKTFAFISRWRLDEQEFSVRRMEFEARANFDRWLTSVTYGNYDAQPSAGLLLPREAIMPSVTLKLTPNWSVSGSALYSIDSSRLATATMSVGYVDECIAISAIFQSNYGYRGDIVPNQVFMLQIALRTLGGTTFSQTLGGPGNSNTGFWNTGGF